MRGELFISRRTLVRNEPCMSKFGAWVHAAWLLMRCVTAPMNLPSCTWLNHDMNSSYRRIAMGRAYQTGIATCTHTHAYRNNLWPALHCAIPGLRSTPSLSWRRLNSAHRPHQIAFLNGGPVCLAWCPCPGPRSKRKSQLHLGGNTGAWRSAHQHHRHLPWDCWFGRLQGRDATITAAMPDATVSGCFPAVTLHGLPTKWH